MDHEGNFCSVCLRPNRIDATVCAACGAPLHRLGATLTPRHQRFARGVVLATALLCAGVMGTYALLTSLRLNPSRRSTSHAQRSSGRPQTAQPPVSPPQVTALDHLLQQRPQPTLQRSFRSAPTPVKSFLRSVTCSSCAGRGSWRCLECEGTGRCKSCGGTGFRGYCFLCRGTGREQCYRCDGTGYRFGLRAYCSYCNGTGRRACFLCDGSGLLECFSCGGSGRCSSLLSRCGGTGRIVCSRCGGRGQLTEPAAP